MFDAIKRKIEGFISSSAVDAASEHLKKVAANIVKKAADIKQDLDNETRLRERREIEKKQEKIRRAEIKRQKRQAALRTFMRFLYFSAGTIVALIGIAIYLAPAVEPTAASESGSSTSVTSASAPAPLVGSRLDANLSSNSNKPASPSRVGQNLSDCVDKGLNYYRNIGSFPTLSNGEDASSKVVSMCRRSNGMAF